jgi:hypothetical protein
MTGTEQGFISVIGTNFTQNSTVLFDGATTKSSLNGPTQIQVDLDVSVSAEPGPHTVQISNSAGRSNVLTFTVYTPQPGPLSFAGQPSLDACQNIAGQGTLADVNNDGLSDLITFSPPNSNSTGQLTVCFGQKNGEFSQPVSAGFALTKGTPTQVLAGDFNRDGNIDLLFIYAGSYLALLNNGSGQFVAGGTGTLPGNGFGRGAVGDFNGDGKLDFVIDTGDALQQPLALLLGNGDGTFGNPTLVGSNAPEKAARVVAVDLNGDGITDLVYADYLPASDPPDSLQMHTLLFHSDGSWTDTLMTGALALAWSFAVADFNHDGVPDVFVVDATTGNGQVLAGKGDGTFSPVGSPAFASDGFLVTPPFVTGDFDDDGNIDIATRLTVLGPDVILLLWGDGQGNFTGQLIASDQSFFLATGDVNGDGIPDILEGSGFGLPGIILGRHDHNFPTAKPFNSPQGNLSSGDVFNDGYNDILVSGSGDCISAAGTPGVIYEFQSNGAPAPKANGPNCNTVLADLDGDGIADLVGSYEQTIFIWKGDGHGNFQAVTQIPVNTPQASQNFVIRDMDGDGKTDIVIAGEILYGRGNLQFDAVALPSTSTDLAFAVGDFDGDSRPDILTGSGILFNQGNRSFTAPLGAVPQCWADAAYLKSPAVGDLNGDGMDDIICGGGSATALEIYLSLGRAGIALDQTLQIPAGVAQTVNVADFNGDGKLDIAVGTSAGPDDVVIFTNNGTGEYQISSYVTGVYAVDSIVGDFNHDGNQDLAFLNFFFDYKPPTVAVLLHK